MIFLSSGTNLLLRSIKDYSVLIYAHSESTILINFGISIQFSEYCQKCQFSVMFHNNRTTAKKITFTNFTQVHVTNTPKPHAPKQIKKNVNKNPHTALSAGCCTTNNCQLALESTLTERDWLITSRVTSRM